MPQTNRLLNIGAKLYPVCLALECNITHSFRIRQATLAFALENRLMKVVASKVPSTPLIDALLRYKGKDSTPMHIPGHKRSQGCPSNLTKILPEGSLRYDLTELPGCRPIYMTPQHDSATDTPICITATELRDTIEAASKKGIKIKVAVVVSPTYYGTCSNISALAAICTSYGIPLVVDEAHGAHFGLHPSFPASALQQGADIVVQSTHKTLNSMGQSSMLHIQGTLVSADRFSQSLRLLQVEQIPAPAFLAP